MVGRCIWKAIDVLRGIWSKLANSYKGYVARDIHSSSGADVWPKSFSQKFSRQTNEVSINFKDSQNDLFWGLIYHHFINEDQFYRVNSYSSHLVHLNKLVNYCYFIYKFGRSIPVLMRPQCRKWKRYLSWNQKQ